jgi:hypothetical protein
VKATHTPSAEHVEFDRMCAEVDEFEPLPAVTPAILEPEDGEDEHRSVGSHLLAGLVSPV